MACVEFPYEVYGEDRTGDLVVTCDHASNAIPDGIGRCGLGLSAEDMSRHIAYDVGAAGVAREAGNRLGAITILSRFSRLVIDANRDLDDPTLIMEFSDGTVVPGNRNLSAAERERRIATLYRPYHDKLNDIISQREDPFLISIHSFCRQLKGFPPRPWHFAVLFGEDDRMAWPLIDIVRSRTELCVGINQPYGGQLPGDSMSRHAARSGRRHILLEIRNDLIENERDQRTWGRNIADWITASLNPRAA